MTDKVYIGHGQRIGKAYEIGLDMVIHLGMFGNLKKEIFYLARYYAEIDRELNPDNVFVVVEDVAKRLRGHVCGNSKDERYYREKSQVLEAPEFAQLREYLAMTKGDRVVATTDSLVKIVDDIVRHLGYETVDFV